MGVPRIEKGHPISVPDGAGTPQSPSILGGGVKATAGPLLTCENSHFTTPSKTIKTNTQELQ